MKGGEKLKTRVALLLILLIFSFTQIIATLTETFIIPTANAASLAKATADKTKIGVRPMGDPIDDPVGPGTIP